MPPIQTRISHYVRWSARKGDAYVRIIQPDLSEKTQQRTGLILGILKIEAGGMAGDALAAHLEDALVRGLAEAVRRLPTEATHEAIFEAAITKVNAALTRAISDKRLPITIDAFNALLLSQRGLEVAAAVWGSPSLLLFHPSKAVGQIKVFDLLEEDESSRAAERSGPSSRNFLHLITGRLTYGDKVLISSDDLRRTLGTADLAPIIADNEPEAATSILHDVFAARKDAGPLALFVTDAVESRESAAAPEPEWRAGRSPKRLSSATQRSIEKLLSTESQTRNIMSQSFLPSLLKDIGGVMGGGLNKIKGALGSRRDTTDDAGGEENAQEPPSGQTAGSETEAAVETEHDQPKKIDIVEARTDKPEETVFAAEGLDAPAEEPPAPKEPSAILVAARRVLSTVRGTANALTSKERRTLTGKKLGDRIDGWFRRLIEKYNALPASGRYLLLAVLAIIMILNHSIILASWQRQHEEKTANYDRTVTAIKQKLDSAEASLIYRDEERARALLEEASAMIGQLPRKNEAEKQIKEVLNGKVAAKYETMRKEVRLGVPDILASIATDGQQATPKLVRLAESGDVIWAGSTTGDIFRISRKDGASSKVGSTPGGQRPDLLLPAVNGVLAWGGGAKISSIPQAGSPSEMSINIGQDEAEIADADIYNQRLYLLDPQHNRIIRVAPMTGGFGQPQFYLKDATDVSTAVSLTIDGLIYVLMSDGRIVKLVKGAQDQFTAGRVDPAPGSPKKIRTSAGSDYLYVLDSSPCRLICFDKKTGALVAQYSSESLCPAADFLVDEKSRIAVFAVGNQLLRFSLPEQK
jgi:hypothetical protein